MVCLTGNEQYKNLLFDEASPQHNQVLEYNFFFESTDLTRKWNETV